ncbi:expressed protein localized to the inner membraneof the chloroplast [Striga asiatica]|uniref:Expressed protein localized to the inner membraneof the chloroplast n=1 Tax=Striga asiatica TaxID=4170 RepID=A0A5A7R1C0_STRAF|nr:expressed protein localized to the inner membraneof the chloroplast [Striga asiatica]
MSFGESGSSLPPAPREVAALLALLPQFDCLDTFLNLFHATCSDRSSGSGADFVAGFLFGGAVFGTLATMFAPQIRRYLLNEDEYGFIRPRGPIYYDEGFEIRHTLNEKISQLNSAIEKISSRLRGGNNFPQVPIPTDAEEAAPY